MGACCGHSTSNTTALFFQSMQNILPVLTTTAVLSTKRDDDRAFVFRAMHLFVVQVACMHEDVFQSMSNFGVARHLRAIAFRFRSVYCMMPPQSPDGVQFCD